jgi:hypothetical protein
MNIVERIQEYIQYIVYYDVLNDRRLIGVMVRLKDNTAIKITDRIIYRPMDMGYYTFDEDLNLISLLHIRDSIVEVLTEKEYKLLRL